MNFLVIGVKQEGKEGGYCHKRAQLIHDYRVGKMKVAG